MCNVPNEQYANAECSETSALVPPNLKYCTTSLYVNKWAASSRDTDQTPQWFVPTLFVQAFPTKETRIALNLAFPTREIRIAGWPSTGTSLEQRESRHLKDISEKLSLILTSVKIDWCDKEQKYPKPWDKYWDNTPGPVRNDSSTQ